MSVTVVVTLEGRAVELVTLHAGDALRIQFKNGTVGLFSYAGGEQVTLQFSKDEIDVPEERGPIFVEIGSRAILLRE